MNKIFTIITFGILCMGQANAQSVLNDDCISALQLFSSPIDDIASNAIHFYNPTILSATSSMEGLNNYFGSAEDDLWFYFVADYSMANIMVNSTANYDAVIEAYNGNCQELNFIGGADNSLDNSIEFLKLSNLVYGETYYIRVYDYSSSTQSYDGEFAIVFTSENICQYYYPLSLTYINQNGNLHMRVNGGMPPYSYYWRDAAGNVYDTPQVGPYQNGDKLLYGVIDADGCAIYQYLVVGQIPLEAPSFTPIEESMTIGENKTIDYKMSVFPNPANSTSTLALSVEKEIEMQIQITNIAGQILSNEVVFVEGDMAFDLKISDLPNGIYFVSAISEKGIQSKELLISK